MITFHWGFNMRCTECCQNRKLEQTGWGPPSAEWVCPTCKQEYYIEKDNSLSKERPFRWPTKQT